MQNAIQQIPPDSGISLNESQQLSLQQAIQGLSREQISWASGYLAGLGQAQVFESTPAIQPPLTILYASQTGNAESIANQLADRYQQEGFQIKLVSTADYRGRDLSRENFLLLIISTQGEGEVPESAYDLQQYLFSDRATRLENLQYAVFALGDSSYSEFCEAGKAFDERLHSLGAERLLDLVKADVDFSTTAQQWQQMVLEQSRQWLPQATPIIDTKHPTVIPTRYDRFNPLTVKVVDNRKITTHDAVSDVHHIELQLGDESFQYQPGDSLGVMSYNDADLVDEVLATLSIVANEEVLYDKKSIAIETLLIEKLELTQLHPQVLDQWFQLSADTRLGTIIEDQVQRQQFINGNQFLDLIQQFPAQLDAQTLVNTLLPIQPRLYSISSSQQRFDDEVHLTVTGLSYQNTKGQPRHGCASFFLNQQLEVNNEIQVYLAENKQFRLPTDNNVPVIMISAGSGIAPFRAFMQQREAESANGENWLVFGNRHFQRDFLYQLEWQKLQRQGLLNRITLAFSRDPHSRTYVQDRLLEESEAVFQWLQKGAWVYVCGSQDLERSVQQTLTEIIQHQSHVSPANAERQFDQLRSEGRYHRDIY